MLEGSSDINQSWLDQIINEYFSFEFYDDKKQYDKNCVFLLGKNKFDDEFRYRYLDKGYKLIICNLWEAATYISVQILKEYEKNILITLGAVNKEYQKRTNNKIISVPNWFWYNESLMIKHLDIATNYVPQRTNQKCFLMPIRRSKTFRDQIIKKFETLLENSIYSYQFGWRKKELPIYSDHKIDINPDRIFEKEWYDQTYFSVVVETTVGSESHLIDGTIPDIFVTEKTFKPIAYQHPFLILGLKGTLNFLKNNGFETYDHIFDESYDNIESFDLRLDAIYKNIKNFNKEQYLDPQTENKIKHNHAHFYDTSRVLQGIKQDLINPILEWADAR